MLEQRAKSRLYKSELLKDAVILSEVTKGNAVEGPAFFSRYIDENRVMAPSSPPPEDHIAPIPEPDEFYYEGPYIVFTAAYHLRRGWCCQSGCRHCPYGFS